MDTRESQEQSKMDRRDNYYQKTQTSQNILSSQAESERRKASRETERARAGSRYSSVLNDDIPPSGSRIQRNRNTFPKARQREGPPALDVFSAPAPTKTGEKIQSQTFYSGGRGRRWEPGSRGRAGGHRGGEREQRAPSERKINSLQRKKKRSYPLTEQDRRARSETRNLSSSRLMTSSLTSSGSLWRPDGKCPSFADILKGGAGVEETGEDNVLREPPAEKTKPPEIFHNVKANDDKEDDSNSFFSNTNVLTPEEVTLIVEADHSNSINEEKLPDSSSDDLAGSKLTECDENKADHTKSISTQNNTLNAFKSYANILSGGIKKVSNVFKAKPREISPKEKIQEDVNVLSPSLSSEEKEEENETFRPRFLVYCLKTWKGDPPKRSENLGQILVFMNQKRMWTSLSRLPKWKKQKILSRKRQIHKMKICKRGLEMINQKKTH